MIIPNCRYDDVYNENYLGKKDKEFIAGYDYAIDYISDLVGDRRLLTDGVKRTILELIENERNEIVMSMIDGMKAKKYEKNRDAVLESVPDLTFYNTRLYFLTGKKENSVR